jgi:hypothetical protein
MVHLENPPLEQVVRAIRAIETEQAYVDQLKTTEPVPEPSIPLTRQQLLEQHEIRIQFLSKGCIVNVGCKAVAFTSVKEAMSAINEYVDNPKAMGEYWRAQFNMV